MSDLGVEIKILSYLWIYGSTKESDIIEYGVRRLDKSEESMKEILNRMDDMGRIRKIVYNELEPPAIYINIGLTLELELELQQSADSRCPLAQSRGWRMCEANPRRSGFRRLEKRMYASLNWARRVRQ